MHTFDLQNENFSYIQQVTGSMVRADAQWSGIQDGVTFSVQHKSFSNVKEATELLNKMVDSVCNFFFCHEKRRKQTFEQ